MAELKQLPIRASIEINPLKTAIFAPYYGKTPQYASALLRSFFLVYDKNISFLSAIWQFLDRKFFLRRRTD